MTKLAGCSTSTLAEAKTDHMQKNCGKPKMNMGVWLDNSDGASRWLMKFSAEAEQSDKASNRGKMLCAMASHSTCHHHLGLCMKFRAWSLAFSYRHSRQVGGCLGGLAMCSHSCSLLPEHPYSQSSLPLLAKETNCSRFMRHMWTSTEHALRCVCSMTHSSFAQSCSSDVRSYRSWKDDFVSNTTKYYCLQIECGKWGNS